MAILNKLHHPAIAKLLGWRIEPPLSPSIVIERADGDLRDLKNSSLIFLPTFIYGIVNALIYQHRLSIVHKDIKPDNVLYVKRPYSEEVQKLIST